MSSYLFVFTSLQRKVNRYISMADSYTFRKHIVFFMSHITLLVKLFHEVESLRR